MDHHFDAAAPKPAGADSFEQTLTALKQHYVIEATGYIDFQLNNFDAFSECDDLNIRDSYVIKDAEDNCYILFAETCTKKTSPKGIVSEHRDQQVWALAYLKHDLGKVKIRPETLRDKIIELLFPIELDFKEDKIFSDSFYVLVNDRPKAIAGINRAFRNAVMDIREDDFVIEINGHTLIIGSRKPIEPERAIYLAEFVVRLVSIYN
jgi:hypothetical protein